MGTLKSLGEKSMPEKEGGRKVWVCSWAGESPWVLPLEGFKDWEFREVSGEGLNRISISFMCKMRFIPLTPSVLGCLGTRH